MSQAPGTTELVIQSAVIHPEWSAKDHFMYIMAEESWRPEIQRDMRSWGAFRYRIQIAVLLQDERVIRRIVELRTFPRRLRQYGP